MIKRGLDLFLAAMLLILAMPILLLAAAAVALTSPGPVLFRQQRAGRGFRRFTILKFRTMAHNVPGDRYTLGADPRITRVGQWLRSTKLDELPQLWNVLCGDMSLVGPRPVIPSLAEDYFAHYRLLLRARPGLTDPASLKYRQETELLQQAADRESFFRKVITPDKVRISLAYLKTATVWSDLGLLCMTALVCIRPSLSRLFGTPPLPLAQPVPRMPVWKFVAQTRTMRADSQAPWAESDTSLLPRAADLRLAEELSSWIPPVRLAEAARSPRQSHRVRHSGTRSPEPIP